MRYDEPRRPFQMDAQERQAMIDAAYARVLKAAADWIAVSENAEAWPRVRYEPDEVFVHPEDGIDAYETWGD